MAPTRKARVARPLLVLLALLAGLNALVFFKGWTPRQGLDLKGGTSVILTPKGERASKGSLDKAVEIIRQRVNGAGVSESEVVTEGINIRIALPSVGRDEALKLVGTTAKLTFRHVAQAVAPQPIDTTSPAPQTTANSTTVTIPPRTPAPSGSPTTQGRALSAALLPGQASPSPTASSTPSPTTRATGSPTPSPRPAAPVDPTELLVKTDCNDPEQRGVGQQFADNQQMVACSTDGEEKYLLDPAEMTGTGVKTAIATIDQSGSGISTGEWIVLLEFNSAGQRTFTALTEKYLNQRFAIVLDGIVQSAPTINDKITGDAQISGSFTSRSAKDLANVLKYGALPIEFDQSQTETISPTLGRDSLRGGLIAGLAGLALVLIYALFYYRGLGLVILLGFLVFGGFNYGLVVLLGETIGFTLTLAGIAGLIVSTGIHGDSYVVFFERLKDEVRDGRTLRQSVDRGFQRSFQTLLAADTISFIAAATLYVLSIGEVRGFAFTLGVATILDVIIAWAFTRPVVTLLTRTKLFSEGRFVGIKAAAAMQPKEA